MVSSSNVAGDGLDPKPTIHNTPLEKPQQKPGPMLIEVEYINDRLLGAMNDEPDGEDVACWERIRSRIKNDLSHTGVSYEILVLEFQLVFKTQNRWPPEPSSYKTNDPIYLSRSRLKPMILFKCPSDDHSGIRKFVEGQKWLKDCKYDIAVMEGNYDLIGVPPADPSSPEIWIQWSKDHLETMVQKLPPSLCGTPGSLGIADTASEPNASRFTVGGTLLIDDNLFGITVGHILDATWYARRSSSPDNIEQLPQKPDVRIGHLVQSTWSGEVEKSKGIGGNEASNYDWGIIRLDSFPQFWAANFVPNKHADHDGRLRREFVAREVLTESELHKFPRNLFNIENIDSPADHESHE